MHERCRCGGQSLEALRERLAVIEWKLSGHIVADVAVEPGDGDAVRIEILTVED